MIENTAERLPTGPGVASADPPWSDFLSSMPSGYGEKFEQDAIQAHARIVADRGGRAAHADIWRTLPYGGAAICVVADDCPGLLSLISASLVVHGFDVVAAQAYGRKRAHAGDEAVDLFWLRRAQAAEGSVPIGAREIAAVAEVLDALVRGAMDVDAVVRRAVRGSTTEAAAMRVRFDGSTLIVEGEDAPGLLLSITRALYRQRVQIVRSDVSTIDLRIHDRFTVVEFDGAPIRAARRKAIEAEVLAALGALPRRVAVP